MNDEKLFLKADLAAEFPIYIYISENKDYLLYSNSIRELLENTKVIKPLEISSEGISFLLQSGVVPPPNTVYKKIFTLGIGGSVQVNTLNNIIAMNFTHKFPFFNSDRDNTENIDEDYILDILAEATISRIDETKPSYLFHSAGKDSNSIALALARADYQDRVICISHQSKGDKDESEISRKIASKLGFQHKKLYEPQKIEQKHLDSINHYFENIPFPCMDNVALAYPIYATQFDFHNSNIIDGSGNDVYMGHIPSKLEFDRQMRFAKFHKLRPITGKLPSGTRIEIATATRTEWCGLFGITYGDARRILDNSFDVYKHWRKEDKRRIKWDYLDLKSYVSCCCTGADQIIRKSRNFAYLQNANLILPFTNEKVAQYFSKLPEKYLFDREKLINKLILRKILKDRIGLDSDKLGKMDYQFDFYSFLMMMKKDVDSEILDCKLWKEKGIEKVLNNLYKKINANHMLSGRIKKLVQRLYLISSWYNKNMYVKRDHA